MAASPTSLREDLTVVIITRDRCDELTRTLHLLETLEEDPGIVVVDNGSADATVATVRRDFPGVTVVPLGCNMGGAGRNVGVMLAGTRFVAFCDDDTWWSPGSLRRAVGLLQARPNLAVVTARIVVEPGGTTDAMSEEMDRSPLPRPAGGPGAPLLSFLAGASTVRAEAFRAVGGFSGRLLIGGEEELTGTDLADAGWEMAYVPELEIHHQASVLRDPHLRRRQGIRNTLWFTWLRRPVSSAALRSAALLRSAPADGHSLRAVVEALRGGWWVVAARRNVGADVEVGLRLLDADHDRSKARQYVS